LTQGEEMHAEEISGRPTASGTSPDLGGVSGAMLGTVDASLPGAELDCVLHLLPALDI
jgi:hypothetical protein